MLVGLRIGIELMRLKSADIDRIMDANVPKPPRAVNSSDFDESIQAARDSLLEGLASYESQSTARMGEVLPLPPRLLTAVGSAPDGQQGLHNTNENLPAAEPGQGRSDIQQPPGRLLPQPPTALRGINLSAIESRADLIRELTLGLPQNEFHLPRIIYRADILDWRLFALTEAEAKAKAEAEAEDFDPELLRARYETMQEYLDAATLYLSYAEGFPALPTGEPLWARMPFEDNDRYAAFTEYCHLPGARQTIKLSNQWPHDQVLQWFHEDYWSLRARCYDMMAAIHAAKMREQRIMACEDNHFLEAERIFARLQSLAAEVDWDLLKEDPAEYVAVMERVAKLQRMSLGLGSGATQQGKDISHESIEVTMRRVAQPNALTTREDSGFDVKQLLRNPEALASAQELVVRMQRTLEHQPASQTIED
jgi:hypothetical protein